METLGVSTAVVDRLLANELRSRTSIDKIDFGPEIRRAQLFTELLVGESRVEISSVLGARSCSTVDLSYSRTRGTLIYNLQCDLTYFHAPETALGPVTVIDDPRRPIRGQILVRRNQQGRYELPALSYFNQYLVFHVGDRFFYYPAEWQVVAAITEWPPEYHQYHHLENEVPVYDFNSREPDVARKGISTISILDRLSEEEEAEIRAAHDREARLVADQPGFEVPPDNFLD